MWLHCPAICHWGCHALPKILECQENSGQVGGRGTRALRSQERGENNRDWSLIHRPESAGLFTGPAACPACMSGLPSSPGPVASAHTAQETQNGLEEATRRQVNHQARCWKTTMQTL